jgi:hypothetical protein
LIHHLTFRKPMLKFHLRFNVLNVLSESSFCITIPQDFQKRIHS